MRIPVPAAALLLAARAACAADKPPPMPPPPQLAVKAAALADETRSKLDVELVALEAEMCELEDLAARLDELVKTYPTAPDIKAVESARYLLLSAMHAKRAAVWEKVVRCNALRTSLETREGAQFLSNLAGIRRNVPTGKRMKTALGMVQGPTGRQVESSLSDIFGLREAIRRAEDRLNAVSERMDAEQKLFEREVEGRARIRRMRVGAAAGLALVLAAGAALLLRRRLESQRRRRP